MTRITKTGQGLFALIDDQLQALPERDGCSIRVVGVCPDDTSDVTILWLTSNATGNDSRPLRKRVSLFCTRA